MKHKPQSLTWGTSALVVALLAGAALSLPFPPIHAQESAASDDPAAQKAPTEPALRKSKRTSEEVFEAIAATLDAAQAFSCNIRQEVVISGRRFIAVGRYTQASGNRMRLEYQIMPFRSVRKSETESEFLASDVEPPKAKEATGSLVQVSDGSVLWTHWKNGNRNELTRRNIADILAAVDEIADYSTAQSLQDLGVGGLQTLVSQLKAGMDFGAVQERDAAGRTWFVLSGRWSKKVLEDIFKIPADVEDPRLPDYIPDYVRVFVDSTSNLPRRIQYLKKHPDPAQPAARPLVTLDLRDLKANPDLPDDTFVFTKPTDENLKEIDLTSKVIDGIRRFVGEEESESPADKSDQ